MISSGSPETKIYLSRYLLTLNRSRIALLAVFLISCVYLGMLEHHFRPQAFGGFYFQDSTSDILMQTLPVATLKAQPLTSLYYLHIQPPMLDSIRTLLAVLAPSSNPGSVLRFVDGALYFIWLLLYGVLNALIYAWVTKITKSMAAGIVAAVIWLFHPAPIVYATMLDGTFPSAVLITWMIYEIWLLSKNQGSAIRLGLAASLSFLTRTVFQWYFAPVLGLSLFLLPIKKQKVILALAIFCAVVFLYCGKQFLLFHTLSTTTYAGYHKTGIIWHTPDKGEMKKYLDRIQAKYPEGARKIRDQYNNEITWKQNLIYNAIFSDKLKDDFYYNVKQIVKSFKFNFNDYWRPSSHHAVSTIAPHLGWRIVYDWVFSEWRLWMLLVISLITWLICGKKQGHHRIMRFLSLSVIISYILIITHLSNRLKWTEAGRLKFFLEPVFLVFILSQLTLLIRSLVSRRFSSKDPKVFENRSLKFFL